MAQMRQGLTARQATGARLVQSYWLLLLAEVYGKIGQAEKGLHILAEARAVADQTGEHFWEAEMYRLQGELGLMQAKKAGPRTTSAEVSLAVVIKPPVLTEVEASFHQALTIARRQEAKSLELRAARSLARLWQQQGKGREAYNLLAPVYGWFTEGFDTADLQEAKAVLEALA
jgi:predicted ATPase